jgi:hypothetical protein
LHESPFRAAGAPFWAIVAIRALTRNGVRGSVDHHLALAGSDDLSKKFQIAGFPFLRPTP